MNLYGVGEQEGEIVDDDLAHGGVESGKSLFSANTSLLLSRFINVDLPTLV